MSRMTRKKSESVWTCKLCAEMEAQGAVVLPIVGSMMQRNGVPDRYVAFKHGALGEFQGWLEFKGARTAVRPLQSAMMEQLQSRNVNVFIVRDRLGLQCSTVNDIYDVPLIEFDNTGYGLMAALRCVAASRCCVVTGPELTVPYSPPGPNRVDF